MKMQNELLDQLSENEMKELLSTLEYRISTIPPIPSIPFSSATLFDCARPDGLALDLRYIEPFVNPAPTLRIPQEIVHPVPSDFLCEHLITVQKHFAMNNEKSCRMLIDAILTEVLTDESNECLFGFCAVENDWEGTGLGYTGSVDYMLGSSRIKSAATMDSFLMVTEAKHEWPDTSVAQVICEAGCLLKRRLEAGKHTPVFAALTNGLLFRFFAIDTDGVVYSSGLCPICLGLGEDDTYKSSTSLSDILRWFIWFMSSIKPASSIDDLTAEKTNDSLAQLRLCFGPKNPISSKRVKTKK
jgi:hypothetical protein